MHSILKYHAKKDKDWSITACVTSSHKIFCGYQEIHICGERNIDDIR